MAKVDDGMEFWFRLERLWVRRRKGAEWKGGMSFCVVEGAMGGGNVLRREVLVVKSVLKRG